MTVGVSDQGVHGSQLMRNSGRGRQHVGLAKPANDARIAQKLILFRMEVDSDADSRDTHSRATSKAKGKSKPTNGKSRGAALVCKSSLQMLCTYLQLQFDEASEDDEADEEEEVIPQKKSRAPPAAKSTARAPAKKPAAPSKATPKQGQLT